MVIVVLQVCTVLIIFLHSRLLSPGDIGIIVGVVGLVVIVVTIVDNVV